jgi:hypothetical protein
VQRGLTDGRVKGAATSDKVQNAKYSGVINECRQSVAMVVVPKLFVVCTTLVFVLLGYCGRTRGQGKETGVLSEDFSTNL